MGVNLTPEQMEKNLEITENSYKRSLAARKYSPVT
jgi:hypothetical protein